MEAPEVDAPREPVPPAERTVGGRDRGAIGGIRRELLRKRLHIATVVAPAAVWILPPATAVLLLALAVLAALAVEWARRQVPWVRYRFLRGTRVMLRGHERHRLSGATHMAIAYLLALLLFPQIVAVTAMLYNALGDAAAAVVGRRWGRHRAAWGKSWEGTAAGLVVNLVIGLAMPGIGVTAVLFGALVSSLLEFLPLPLDDNLRVTVGGGLALWAGMSMG